MMEMSHEINELSGRAGRRSSSIAPALKEAEDLGFKTKDRQGLEVCRSRCCLGGVPRPLAENDLAVSQLPIDAEPGRIALTSILLHASGQYLRGTFSMPLMQNTPHGAGSALT